MSLQNERVTSGDEENAGYESSNESEDLSATAGDEIEYPSPTKELPLDIQDNNFIWVV